MVLPPMENLYEEALQQNCFIFVSDVMFTEGIPLPAVEVNRDVLYLYLNAEE